jgi:glycoside/pentoside/hexuronide:cation symporter, GPH family
LLALLLYTSGYSMFNVPYMAMPSEMTNGYHERSSLHGYRVAFAAARRATPHVDASAAV